MTIIQSKDYIAAAFALQQRAQQTPIPYVLGGMTLSGMDCQGLCEYLLIQCGVPRRECNLAGSNAHYRACTWTGTPEECKKRFGRIPAGAWLFLLKQDGGEPAKYRPDGVGNASHMGVYLGEGQGVLQASASRGGVVTTSFNGRTGNGGWNRVGLCQWVNYDLEADDPQPEEGGEDSQWPMTAQVTTPDGNPVKMRARPSRRSSLYWKVPNGETVQVDGLVESEGILWARARYGRRSGYIMTAFLTGG